MVSLYVVHLDWKEFLSQAFCTDEVYVVQYAEPIVMKVGLTGYTTMIVATYHDVRQEHIHAARIIIEKVGAGDVYAKEADAAMKRLEEARELVEQSIISAGYGVLEGILLCHGLKDDLQGYQTSHSLWRWEGTSPLERKLIRS